jgi:hypothetical protein
MVLEKKAKEKLEDLLDMSRENFEEMALRWDELKPKSELGLKDSDVFIAGENLKEMALRWDELKSKSELGLKDSDVFIAGYVFGKIEHKFIQWFYSEFGRSQTDEEYQEFWHIVKDRLTKIKTG